MSFGALLILHSWFRWAVVVVTSITGARCLWGWTLGRRWTPNDAALGQLWVGVVDIQVSLGFLLYFIASPLAERARHDVREAWTDGSLRFFGILHPVAMVTAAFVTHAAWIWTRRADNAGERFRRLGIGVVVALAVVTLAIPWPFLPYGRPFARIER